jgi:hypothetical protein
MMDTSDGGVSGGRWSCRALDLELPRWDAGRKVVPVEKWGDFSLGGCGTTIGSTRLAARRIFMPAEHLD